MAKAHISQFASGYTSTNGSCALIYVATLINMERRDEGSVAPDVVGRREALAPWLELSAEAKKPTPRQIKEEILTSAMTSTSFSVLERFRQVPGEALPVLVHDIKQLGLLDQAMPGLDA